MKLAAVIVVVAIAGFGFSQVSEDFSGKPMPKFRIKDTRGAVLTNASLKGKIVVIDFWATWCVPCHVLAPAIEKLNQSYRDHGVVVIGADSHENTPGPHAAAYKKKHGYSYRFSDGNDALADSMGILNFPTVLILDRKGVIRYVSEGYNSQTERDLNKAVRKLLKS